MTHFASSTIKITTCPRCKNKLPNLHVNEKESYSVQCDYCKAVIQVKKEH